MAPPPWGFQSLNFMTMSLVLFEKKGTIGRLTLNNPENLNAMTEAMGTALQDKVKEINSDPDLRVVVITGQGRAFSAGGDLDFILEHTRHELEDNQQEMVEFYYRFLSLRRIQVPTIAMINGHAIGAGFLIALACDLRYADAEAKLAVNFPKIGLSSGMGGLYWVTKLAGPARAADLLLTGRTIDAEEARDMGLINEVCSKGDLESRVQEIAEQISANAPLAIKILKKGIQKAVCATLDEVIDYESHGQAETFSTQDLIEGVEAIRAKRSPKFQGE